MLWPCSVPKILSYRDLTTWQKGVDLADLVYRITEKFPRTERFGLVVQMRKAAVSVPSNVAEGTRHRTPGYVSRVIIAPKPAVQWRSAVNRPRSASGGSTLSVNHPRV